MDWSKIKKILDLYVRKNRIISVPTEEHEFTYRIVPKSENAALVSKNATPRDNPVAAKSIDSCLDELDTSDDTTKDIRVAAKSIEIYLDKLDAKDDFTKNIPVTPVSYLDELDTQNHTTKDLLKTVESMGNNLGKTITVNPEISKRMDCCLDELEPLDDTTKDIPEAVENINSCFDELDNLDDTTKDIPVEEENVASPTKSEDLKTLFPYLKNTNTESLVLWDFLWALLKDENYKKTVTWVSFSNLKFSIVNPFMLATLFGQVKQNPNMDWSKIKKILDLYLRKNRIISVPTEEHEFTYRIVPKSENAALVSKNATNKDNPIAEKSIDSCLDDLDTSDDTTKDILVAVKSIDIYLDKLDAKGDSTKNIPVAAESYLDELDTQNISEAVESMDNSLDNTIKVIPENSERMDCSVDELEHWDDT